MAFSNTCLPSTCNIIGLISGTSADGVDACLVEFSRTLEAPVSIHNINFKVLVSKTYPYLPSLSSRILSLGVDGNVQDVCNINFEIGEFFGNAVSRLLAEVDTPRVSLTAVGSHGQTVYHDPPIKDCHSSVPDYTKSLGSTLQLGESACIANLCGVVTVSDFRYADVAVGGQGAPLTPMLDQLLLQHHFISTGQIAAMLNIGGIANLSVLCPMEREMLAFDCGPGNMLIDAACRRFFNREFDCSGEIARSGDVNIELVEYLLSHSYHSRELPKSTGREEFGEGYFSAVVKVAERLSVAPNDLVATLTRYTAHCITAALQEVVLSWLHSRQLVLVAVFVSGGGVHNAFLLELLRERIPLLTWESTHSLGIDPDGKEALCFALLAYLTLNNCPGNIPSVTGADRKVILGKIVLPPPQVQS